jgi:small subunit ribosomal protein S2|tara:strand:- start:6554 stop:7408 length:855 start_codon:yes stop_codon:yes gene_type:complete
MERNGIHIINLEETLKGLTKVIDFITDNVADGGEVLFVGTKKNAKDIIQQEADKCGMFYVVERWLGGTLTNFSTIRKSIKRLQLLEKESSPLYESATKKEILSLEREMIRLQDLHRGIKDMKRLPNAIFIVDAKHESIATNEAHRLEIPVIAIVDTNTDPEVIDYPIPANDDSIRAIKLIVGEVSRAICDARSIAYPDGGAIPVAAGEEETAEAESITSENGEMAEGAELKEAESEEIVMEEEATLSEEGEVQDSETEETAAVEEVQEPEEIVEEKETEKSNDN